MDSSNIVLAGEYVTLLLYGLPLLHVLLALGKYTSACADCKLPYRAIMHHDQMFHAAMTS